MEKAPKVPKFSGFNLVGHLNGFRKGTCCLVFIKMIKGIFRDFILKLAKKSQRRCASSWLHQARQKWSFGKSSKGEDAPVKRRNKGSNPFLSIRFRIFCLNHYKCICCIELIYLSQYKSELSRIQPFVRLRVIIRSGTQSISHNLQIPSPRDRKRGSFIQEICWSKVTQTPEQG